MCWLILVCDQESTHRMLCAHLGAVGRHSSFIDHEGDEVFFIFDVPHLFKSFRNSLFSYYLMRNNETITNFSHILSFWAADRKGFLRLAPKITDKHISPNTKQKMKVKYATQMISHTVASALKVGVDLKKLDCSALQTADTIEKMNDLFDILNCQSTSAVGFKRAIRKDKYSNNS